MDFTSIVILLMSAAQIFEAIVILKLAKECKRPTAMDSKLYDEQIKNYKRILRLNERYIKEIKSKGEQSYEQSMVQPEEQRRVY